MIEPYRCPWCGTDPLYVAYHDEEWGVPVHDPRALWECLMLEAFQAGIAPHAEEIVADIANYKSMNNFAKD